MLFRSIDYVTANWPDAIMYDTYNAAITPEYDSIPKSICPLTAFRLGLCAGFPGAEQFPEVTRDPPGTYRLDPETDAAPFAEIGGGTAAAPVPAA